MRRPQSFNSRNAFEGKTSVRQDILLVAVIVLAGLLDVFLVFGLGEEPTLAMAFGMLILVVVGIACLLYSLRE